MYMLGVGDRISILVRVDAVRTVPNEFHGMPELQIEATLRLSPNADKDVRVILWGGVEDATYLTVNEEFVARDVVIKGYCSEDHVARERAALSAIWFGDRQDECLALIRREAPSRIS